MLANSPRGEFKALSFLSALARIRDPVIPIRRTADEPLVEVHMDVGKANPLRARRQIVDLTAGLDSFEIEAYQRVSGMIGPRSRAPRWLWRTFRTDQLEIDLHIRARGFDSDLNCPAVEADMNGVDVDQPERIGFRYLISWTGISEGLKGEEYRYRSLPMGLRAHVSAALAGEEQAQGHR